MALVFDEHSKLNLFQCPKACLEFLTSNKSPLSKYTFLKSITSDENYGILQHTPIDFDITKLAQLADDINRHNEITVMIIDYHMPEMDGFSLAKACDQPLLQKILLTGKAQDSQAISGFNSNLIQRYIQKNESEMEEKLINYSKKLSSQYFRILTAPLLAFLEVDGLLPLSDKIFIEFFEGYCEKNKICEYYLIDKQGSFLCINDKGIRSCLVLQSEKGIDSWIETYGHEKEFSETDLAALSNRTKIPFFGIGKEAWEFEDSSWQKHLYLANLLEGRNIYYWATVELKSVCDLDCSIRRSSLV
jgi:CheY-like chemotaxis protein